MKIIYPAIFHNEDGQYWVEFPDLDGCFSDGETAAEALLNAKEAMALYCSTALENKTKLRSPSPIQQITVPDGCFTSLIEADLTVKKASVKKTLTIPAWLNEAALNRGVNFSEILQNALIKELGIN
nr:type II toxin-antitoxin system HicB family antitoxin [Clostridia bacterium]